MIEVYQKEIYFKIYYPLTIKPRTADTKCHNILIIIIVCKIIVEFITTSSKYHKSILNYIHHSKKYQHPLPIFLLCHLNLMFLNINQFYIIQYKFIVIFHITIVLTCLYLEHPSYYIHFSYFKAIILNSKNSCAISHYFIYDYYCIKYYWLFSLRNISNFLIQAIFKSIIHELQNCKYNLNCKIFYIIIM